MALHPQTLVIPPLPLVPVVTYPIHTYDKQHLHSKSSDYSHLSRTTELFCVSSIGIALSSLLLQDSMGKYSTSMRFTLS